MAILYPSPTFPTTFSSGTSTSSNDRASVEEARMPSLSSFFPFPNPFQPDSTRKAVIPRYPFDRSTFAKMRKISASSPFVIQSLDPFRTQRSPFLAAVVARANASDPEPASESAYAPTFDFASCGRYLFFSAGLAQRRRALLTRVFWTSTTTAAAASTRASASMTAIDVAKFRPSPPSSSGISIPIRSRSKNFRTRAGSMRFARSISIDFGAISSTANRWTFSAISRSWS